MARSRYWDFPAPMADVLLDGWPEALALAMRSSAFACVTAACFSQTVLCAEVWIESHLALAALKSASAFFCIPAVLPLSSAPCRESPSDFLLASWAMLFTLPTASLVFSPMVWAASLARSVTVGPELSLAGLGFWPCCCAKALPTTKVRPQPRATRVRCMWTLLKEPSERDGRVELVGLGWFVACAMPTNPERMVHGFGDASGLRTVDTPAGRVGALICWENYMPLARYALYALGVEIYIAPTYDAGDGWISSMRSFQTRTSGSTTGIRWWSIHRERSSRGRCAGMACYGARRAAGGGVSITAGKASRQMESKGLVTGDAVVERGFEAPADDRHRQVNGDEGRHRVVFFDIEARHRALDRAHHARHRAPVRVLVDLGRRHDFVEILEARCPARKGGPFADQRKVEVEAATLDLVKIVWVVHARCKTKHGATRGTRPHVDDTPRVGIHHEAVAWVLQVVHHRQRQVVASPAAFI
ncbi:hypothetical protein EEB15_02810 [Ramlibacter sp. WS9]|nr:hypothetical protein EEB15_02810 [Ramlibacter sp. WS9]